MEEERIPVRVSLGHRARPWLTEIDLYQGEDEWFLTEDHDWKDPYLWQEYDEPQGRIIIDYHRSEAFAGLRQKPPGALPFVEKWRALGYKVYEVFGDDGVELKRVLKEKKKGQVVIVHTKIRL